MCSTYRGGHCGHAHLACNFRLNVPSARASWVALIATSIRLPLVLTYLIGLIDPPELPQCVLKPTEITSALPCVLASKVIEFSVRLMLASSINVCA